MPRLMSRVRIPSPAPRKPPHCRGFSVSGALGFLRCDDACFRGQVVPGDTFVILVEEIDASPRRFISKTQGLVRGKLVFEAKITGMAI